MKKLAAFFKNKAILYPLIGVVVIFIFLKIRIEYIKSEEISSTVNWLRNQEAPGTWKTKLIEEAEKSGQDLDSVIVTAVTWAVNNKYKGRLI